MSLADGSVTGGLGSVGIGLARTLSYYGADVILVDLLPSPSEEIWSEHRPNQTGELS